MDKSSQIALVERAAKLGRGLKYRYDGMAHAKCFEGNDHQWALIKNYGVTTFRGLRDVSVALDLIEGFKADGGEKHG